MSRGARRREDAPMTCPALIDLHVLGAELEPARREGLLEDLSDLVRRHVAELAPGTHAWAFAREVAGWEAYEDGRPMERPHYRLHVTLPVAAGDAAREALATQLARRVLRTEGPYPSAADLPRVAVSFA
jgi:hypothetical protein